MPTLTASPTLDLLGLANELTRRKEAMADYIVDTRRLSVSSDADGTDLVFDDPDGAAVSYRVNDYAHGQIAERLGIPKRYYDRMRADAPTLLDTNVLQWLWAEPERRLIRTLDGNVRAFLSDRYRRLDNFDLMEHLLPVLGEIDGLQFHVAALTDLRLYVRAILPSLEAEIRVGDIVQAGVEIRNSEVGAGKFEVGPYLWRLVCKNGMVSNVGRMARAHVGSRVMDVGEDGVSVFAQDTIEADDKAFFLAARDLVRNALTEVSFNAIVEQMRESAEPETRVESAVGATERLADTFSLSDREQASVLNYLIEGGDLSRWGVANAVTAAAKDAEDYDRLVEMEAIGGDLVEMSARDWRAIREAMPVS